MGNCITKECEFSTHDGESVCVYCVTEFSADLIIFCHIPECSKSFESRIDLEDHYNEVHRGVRDFTENMENTNE